MRPPPPSGKEAPTSPNFFGGKEVEPPSPAEGEIRDVGVVAMPPTGRFLVLFFFKIIFRIIAIYKCLLVNSWDLTSISKLSKASGLYSKSLSPSTKPCACIASASMSLVSVLNLVDPLSVDIAIPFTVTLLPVEVLLGLPTDELPDGDIAVVLLSCILLASALEPCVFGTEYGPFSMCLLASIMFFTLT